MATRVVRATEEARSLPLAGSKASHAVSKPAVRTRDDHARYSETRRMAGWRMAGWQTAGWQMAGWEVSPCEAYQSLGLLLARWPRRHSPTPRTRPTCSPRRRTPPYVCTGVRKAPAHM